MGKKDQISWSRDLSTHDVKYYQATCQSLIGVIPLSSSYIITISKRIWQKNTDDWVLHGWKRARNWTKRKLQCTSFYNHVGREVASNWQLEKAELTYAMPSFAATIRNNLMWIHFKICDAWKHAPPEPYHPKSCLHPYISISLEYIPLSIYIYMHV